MFQDVNIPTLFQAVLGQDSPLLLYICSALIWKEECSSWIFGVGLPQWTFDWGQFCGLATSPPLVTLSHI